MQCYFITQAVDILYGMLCARGLADYGTEGVVILNPDSLTQLGTNFGGWSMSEKVAATLSV